MKENIGKIVQDNTMVQTAEDAYLLGLQEHQMAGIKIGILGKAGVGKNFFADQLCEALRIPYACQCAFADVLYEICEDEHGMTKKDRKLLQDVGRIKREEDPLFFVNRLMEKIEDMDFVIVTDVRQVNEYKALKEAGFLFVRVEADLDLRLKRIAERDQIVITEEYVNLLSDKSETDLDHLPAMRFINNSNTQEAFNSFIPRLKKLILQVNGGNVKQVSWIRGCKNPVFT